MKLQPDVGHVHAVLCACCGVAAMLYAVGLLFDVDSLEATGLVLSFFGLLFGGVWCGLFALILRGTVVSRSVAGVGILATFFAVFTAMCAVVVN